MQDKTICIDAGIVVRRVVFPDDVGIQQKWVEWETDGTRLVAPQLIFFEVTNVLHRYQHLGWFTSLTVQIALSAALALPVELFGDPGIHIRARELAEQYRLKAAYDVHYLALAERLGADFYTTDRRLITAMGDLAPSWVYYLHG